MLEAIAAFCAICRGEEVETCLEPEAPGFPHFQVICSLFLLFRKEIGIVGIDRCEYVIEATVATVDALKACGRESQRYAAVRDDEQEEQFYYFGRESTYGLLPFWEFTCVYSNIVLSITVREDPLLQLFVRLIVRACIIVNDIISIRKEITNGEKYNILIIRGRKMGGSAALELALEDIDHSLQEIVNLEKTLVSKYENSTELRELQRYLELGKANVDANTQFMFISKRYGQPSFVAHLLHDISDHEK